jgi:hypothetical protein
MTGDGVLKKGDDLDGHGFASPSKSTTTSVLTVDIKPGDIVAKLTEVVERLQMIKKKNDQLQAQFASGSASWHTCESIDDDLHEISTLLGE